jgi:hypothetical protein
MKRKKTQSPPKKEAKISPIKVEKSLPKKKFSKPIIERKIPSMDRLEHRKLTIDKYAKPRVDLKLYQSKDKRRFDSIDSLIEEEAAIKGIQAMSKEQTRRLIDGKRGSVSRNLSKDNKYRTYKIHEYEQLNLQSGGKTPKFKSSASLEPFDLQS